MNRFAPQNFRVIKGRQPCSVNLQYDGDQFVFFSRIPQTMQAALNAFNAVAQQHAGKSKIQFGYVDLSLYPNFAKILEESTTPPGAALYVYYKDGAPRTFHSAPLITPNEVAAKLKESFAKSEAVAVRHTAPPAPVHTVPQRSRPEINPRGGRGVAQPSLSDFGEQTLVSPPEVIPHNRPWQSDFVEGEL